MKMRCSMAVQRVNNIVPRQDYNSANRKSLNYLMKEYIRRAALFLKYAYIDYKYPFFSAARAIGRENIIDFSKLCPNMTEYTDRYLIDACKHYVEWITLADEGQSIALMFEDLYEPLILLIERGGKPRIEHQILDIGRGCSIPLYDGITKYASDVPYDINIEALEWYDKEKP